MPRASPILSGQMNILGINAFHGDASAALVKDGRLVAAIEEERLNRRKHCAGFPALAIRAVLESGGVAPGEIDHVGDLARSQGEPAQEDPLHAAEAPVVHEAGQGPAGQRRQGARRRGRARRGAGRRSAATLRAKLHNVEHHKSHVSSAFFVSPSRRRRACRSTASATSCRPCARSGAIAISRSSIASSSRTPPGSSTRRSRSSSASTGTARSGR